MATKASRIALAGSNISSTGEVDADLLDNIDSAAFLSLDSNGRLGIGTSSPLGKLHVRDGTAQAGIDHSYIYDASAISIEATEPSLQLMAEDSGTHGGSILWRYGNNTFAAIANPATDTVDFTYGVTTADEFQVHSGTNMSSYLKIMSIGADGNLLVGQTTAYTGAGVTISGDGVVQAERNNISGVFNRTSTDGDIVQFRKDGSTVGSIGTHASNITIGTGATGLRFYDTDNVIMPRNPSTGANVNGTISLGEPLNRFKDLYLSNGIKIVSPNTTSAAAIVFGDSADAATGSIGYWNSDDSLRFSGYNNTERMRIDSSGNVSIGSSDDNPFSWGGSSNNVSITSAGGNDWAQLSLKGNGTGGTGINLGAGSVRHAGIFSLSGSDLQFATNATNSGTTTTVRMTIKSGGNVGIGTDNPLKTLDVRGSIGLRRDNGLMFFTDSNTTGSTNANGAFIGMAHNAGHHVTSGDGGFASNADSLVIANYHTGGGDIILATTNSGPYPSGRVIIKEDGNVGIGTNQPGAKLTLDGGTTTTQAFKTTWSSGTGRIAFVGGTNGADGSGATSTAAKIESLATAPGGAATGDLKLIVNSGDSFVTGIEIVPDGAVRLALQGSHTTIGSWDDPRAPYGWNNITTNNHADVFWGLNSRLIGGGTGHDFEVVTSHGSVNSAGIMFTANGNPESPNNILFFANGGSGTAGTVHNSSSQKFTMNSGGSFLAEEGNTGAVIRLANIGHTGVPNHYIELGSNLPGYSNGQYNCLKTSMNDLHFVAGNTYTGYINYNGGFTDVSDASLKENVVTIDGALDKVEQLQGRYFTWISEDQSDDRQIGFIAQEVEAVIPELVTTSDTGIKGMSYGKTTALLVEAIKEQQTIIDDLKARIEALEG